MQGGPPPADWLLNSDVVWIKESRGLNYRQLGEFLSVGRETARRWYLGTQTPASNTAPLIERAGGLNGEFNDPARPRSGYWTFTGVAPRVIGNPELVAAGARQKTFSDAMGAISYLKMDDDYAAEEWKFDPAYFAIERRAQDEYRIYFQQGK